MFAHHPAKENPRSLEFMKQCGFIELGDGTPWPCIQFDSHDDFSAFARSGVLNLGNPEKYVGECFTQHFLAAAHDIHFAPKLFFLMNKEPSQSFHWGGQLLPIDKNFEYAVQYGNGKVSDAWDKAHEDLGRSLQYAMHENLIGNAQDNLSSEPTTPGAVQQEANRTIETTVAVASAGDKPVDASDMETTTQSATDREQQASEPVEATAAAKSKKPTNVRVSKSSIKAKSAVKVARSIKSSNAKTPAKGAEIDTPMRSNKKSNTAASRVDAIDKNRRRGNNDGDCGIASYSIPSRPTIPSLIDSRKDLSGIRDDDDVSEIASLFHLTSPSGDMTVVTSSPQKDAHESTASKPSGRRGKKSLPPHASRQPAFTNSPELKKQGRGRPKKDNTESSKDKALVLKRTDERIPVFDDVSGTLKRFGYSFSKGKYCLPGCDNNSGTGGSFDTEVAFRRHLCECGVEIDPSELPEDERSNLVLWVRYAIVTAPEFEGMIPDLEPLEYQSVSRLLKALGITSSTMYVAILPSDQSMPIAGHTAFMSLDGPDGLYVYLARHGLPTTCNFDEVSPLDRLRLEMYLAEGKMIDKLTFVSVNKDLFSPGSSNGRARPQRSAIKRERPMSDVASAQSSVSKRQRKTPPTQAKSQLKPETQAKTLRKPVSRQKQDKHASVDTVAATQTMAHSSIIATSPLVPKASRISLTPCAAHTAVPLPDQRQTNGEKLEACLEVLKTSFQAQAPVFDTSAPKSHFATNLTKVEQFVQAVIDSEGSNSGKEGDSASLYVCGGPGIGKTSGVKFVCDRLLKTALIDDDNRAPVLCYVNAVSVKASPNPTETLLDEMAVSAGYTRAKTHQALKGLLSRGEKKFIILIMDEVDALVSHFKATNVHLTKAEKALKTILDCAADESYPLAVIGISNIIGNTSLDRLHSIGKFQTTVSFKRYSETELVYILQSRLGTKVVAKPALDLISKKVAKGSGDARAALDMAADAVKYRLKNLSSIELLAMATSSKPLVTPKEVMQAIVQAQDGLAERVRDLPLFGKIVLCVLVTLAQENVHCAVISHLKECVTACLVDFPDDLQIMTTENFKDLLDMLVDSGLLKMDHVTHDARNRLSFAQFQLSTIRLGTQLEDVSIAVQKDMVDKQAFWAKIQHHAKQFWRE